MMKKILISVFIFAAALGLFIYVAQKKSVVVKVERTFNAPIEKVWTVWNDTESIKQWWSPKGYSAPVIKNDFRVDGSFLFSMQAPDGKMSWNTGKYIEIIEHQKIVSKMSFSDENGNMVPAAKYGLPGDWPDEVTVTVEFKDLGGKTQVHIEETGIPLIMSVFARMGWDQQFDKFENLLK
jgi:uncharacterized protein YndB with AHSA1/START domain